MGSECKFSEYLIKVFILLLFIHLSDARPGYIVGGDDTNKGAYKYLVHVESPLGKCGGILISKKHVMTAKHCTQGVGPKEFTLTLGEYNTQIDEGHEQKFTGKKIYRHHKADLAIIKLKGKASTNKYVSPVKLNCHRGMAYGSSAHAVGWGQTVGDASSGPLSDTPLDVLIERQADSVCEVGANLYMERWEMCVGNAGAVNRENTCFGDSGGPLVQGGRLVGVTVAGPSECKTSQPYSIFVMTYYLCSWIVDICGAALPSKWDQWYNKHQPDAFGEREEKQALALIRPPCYGLFNQYAVKAQARAVSCPSGCRDRKAYTLNHLQGLICRNSQQKSGCTCCDYKVRFKCLK